MNLPKGGVFIITASRDAVDDITAIVTYVSPEPLYLYREALEQVMMMIHQLLKDQEGHD